jgi:hypothetical protein
MDADSGDNSKSNASKNIEFRIMPSGEGRWYWELIQGARQVITRGIADNEPDACKEAGDAAHQAKLIP